jgi:hypothetical protein
MTPDDHVRQLGERHPKWMVHYEELSRRFYALPIELPGTWWSMGHPGDLDHAMSALEDGRTPEWPATAVDLPAVDSPAWEAYEGPAQGAKPKPLLGRNTSVCG